MLLTMEHAYKEAVLPMPNEERIDKVSIMSTRCQGADMIIVSSISLPELVKIFVYIFPGSRKYGKLGRSSA